ncbi:MAG TPA: 3-isopropylmalate dehydratase large subunit [Rhodobacteraceae bacterium]|nr:3-isopropylmalate dehydratase large subunit [Paracoccaceae bacterium]
MNNMTLYDKIWESHCVKHYDDGQSLLYVDRHLVQEVSSPQSFAGLAERGLTVRRPDASISVADHAVPTQFRENTLKDSLCARQVARLIENVLHHKISYIDIDDIRHGIVHVIGPELGFTLPGSTLVCGDSHTSTHGAFGCLAFGIGSSECETVLASQALRQTKQKQMRVILTGELSEGVSIKDIILALISKIGTAGGQGFAIEYTGPAIATLSMEARMTLCNMSIEAGSRIGIIAPDDITYSYLKNKPLAPKGEMWTEALAHWKTLKTDDHAVFKREVTLNMSEIAPHVSWGTTPADSSPITGNIPNLEAEANPKRRRQVAKSLNYMGLTGGVPLDGIKLDKVFIGSCTNSRLEDLRRGAKIVKGRSVAKDVTAMVVPGSAMVRALAEAEGLDKIFIEAGFEWRQAGCSMCVAMNDDRLLPGERCASTSNRNFEGRQGQGGRTHLMSPEMAAAAAITGHITDVRKLMVGSYA